MHSLLVKKPAQAAAYLEELPFTATKQELACPWRWRNADEARVVIGLTQETYGKEDCTVDSIPESVNLNIAYLNGSVTYDADYKKKYPSIFIGCHLLTLSVVLIAHDGFPFTVQPLMFGAREPLHNSTILSLRDRYKDIDLKYTLTHAPHVSHLVG